MNKISQRRNRLFAELLPEFVEYIKEVKGLKQNQARTVKGNNFEQMEKIRFLLEQEGYELDQLLQETIHSRDEIDAFLRNKLNTKLIASSGAYKILETVAFTQNFEVINYDDLLKVVDKKIENEIPKMTRKKDLIHEITRNIFSKVQKAQQKKIKEQTLFTAEYYAKSKSHRKLELETLTQDKEIQTDNEDEIFRKKSMAVRKMLKNQEIDSYTKDLEVYNEEILRKCHAFELQKNTLENEKNDFAIKLKQKELKLKVKKEKNEALKLLVKELKEKLFEISEKQANQLNLLKNKEKEYEKLLIKQEENAQTYTVQLKEMNSKQDHLEKKLRESRTMKLPSKIDEQNSPSLSPSPVNLYENKSSQNMFSDTLSKRKTSKKSSISKRKRSSTMDNNLVNRLSKRTSIITPQLIKNEKKSSDIMQRSRSLYVAKSKKPQAKIGVQRQSMMIVENITKNLDKPSIIPGTVSISKSFIESNNSSNRLKTLEEDSKDLNDLQIQNPPILEASIDKESIVYDKESDQITFQKATSISLKDFSEKNIGNSKFHEKNSGFLEKKRPETQEMAVMAIAENKEKETMANFIDRTEIYINKLQDMAEKNYSNMRYIIERIFLHRNHQEFIDEITYFLKNWSVKKLEKTTQTDDFSPFSIKHMSQSNMSNSIIGKAKTSTVDTRYMSKTSRIDGFLSRNGETSNFSYGIGENDRYNYEDAQRESMFKSHKSQSQHIVGSKSKIFDLKNLNNNKDFAYEFDMKNHNNEKPQIPSNFLFNKAIQGDIFHDLNRKNSYTQKEKNQKSLLLSRKNMISEDLIMKIDILKEEQENLEQEKLIKRLSKHIQEIKEKDKENYAKIKHFIKYPFKSIRERLGVEGEIIDFEDGGIEEVIERFVRKHRNCGGGNCKHLQRFYQRIGFINTVMPGRNEILVHKQVINKLPNLEEKKEN